MEQYFRSVMSGQSTGVLPSILRALTRIIEPIYRTVVESRNKSFTRGSRAILRVGKPVISVGNITTGGTGKTPVVAWLARQLRSRGRNVAILMRGYKSTLHGSDEQRLLSKVLNADSTQPPIVVHAKPDRAAGAQDVLRVHPQTDVFILDDGFQHRRLHRDFDLVLIDATNPFGYDHVLPRGLLREPLASLSRASAFLITRIDQALPGELPEIEQCLREHAPHLPIYRCNHAHRRLVDESGKIWPIDELSRLHIVAFGGIGNPDAFAQQLERHCEVVAQKWFGDHHDYTRTELSSLQTLAQSARADMLITTEKDWVKLAPLCAGMDFPVPILRVEMEIEFVAGDEQKLLDQIGAVVIG